MVQGLLSLHDAMKEFWMSDVEFIGKLVTRSKVNNRRLYRKDLK
jgi:hypothetical protein